MSIYEDYSALDEVVWSTNIDFEDIPPSVRILRGECFAAATQVSYKSGDGTRAGGLNARLSMGRIAPALATRMSR
jgi:hypothetical protein